MPAEGGWDGTATGCSRTWSGRLDCSTCLQDNQRMRFTAPTIAPCAPDVHTALPPIGNLATLATRAETKSATLTFIVIDAPKCIPTWEKQYLVGANNGELRHEVNSFVAGVRCPVICFGDDVDNDLASVRDSPTAMETAYQQVINRNQAYALYFDIEGAQLNGTTSANMRNKTFNLLQGNETACRHAVTISRTLPVLPPGCSLTPCFFAVSGHQA